MNGRSSRAVKSATKNTLDRPHHSQHSTLQRAHHTSPRTPSLKIKAVKLTQRQFSTSHKTTQTLTKSSNFGTQRTSSPAHPSDLSPTNNSHRHIATKLQKTQLKLESLLRDSSPLALTTLPLTSHSSTTSSHVTTPIALTRGIATANRPNQGGTRNETGSVFQANLNSITTLQALLSLPKRPITTSTRQSAITLNNPSRRGKKMTKRVAHSPLRSLLESAKAQFSTAQAPVPTPEDVTQGANLVQIQQAVNQWAHLNYRGMEFLRSGKVGDLDNAESCFNECSNAMERFPLLPYRSLSLANLASCLMRKGNYKEAIKIFQPLTQQLLLFKQVAVSQIATIHMELASAYELSGQHDLAVKELYVASSRFVHAAAHFLGQIQGSDTTHFAMSAPASFGQMSPGEQDQHIANAKNLTRESEQNPPQHDVLREDQRAMAYSSALESWRTALGCRYSAIVLQHRMANLDFAFTELRKLATVYKYIIDCCETVQKAHWDAGVGEVGDVSTITDEKGQPVDIDKTLKLNPKGGKILELYPQCPPEAKVVTSDLARLFPDVSLHHLNEIYGRTTVEYVSVLHSLANVYIDLGDFEKVCSTLEASVDCMNPMDEEAFLQVASESSKTLRLLYEKLLLEQQNYSEATGKKDSEPTIVQVSEVAKIRFESKTALEATIKKINTSRANILALFSTFIQANVLHTTAPIEPELFGASNPAKIAQRIRLEEAAAALASKSGQPIPPTAASSYQSSVNSSTIRLDDLPQDAQQFFNFGHDKKKRLLESGEFYETMRKVMQHEMGPQFQEDMPELLQLKPPGYKALHERHHLGDVGPAVEDAGNNTESVGNTIASPKH